MFKYPLNKNTMKRQFIICTIMLFIIAGCTKENELKKSVMIYDTEFTDLPAYSEWGYNTFGAYYDRQVFISNSETVPAKVIVTDSTMSFLLDGRNNYSYSLSNDIAMTFKLTGFTPASYADLIALNDTTFDLTNPAYKVIVTIDTMEYLANILSGDLYFKRAQNLLVDEKQTEVILSGYFGFQALVNNKPVTISDGRFDVGIGPDNFYNF
jgi:hypothetical protein